MKIEIFGADQIDTVAPEWERLEKKLKNTSLTCSWVWTKTWLEVYGAVVPHWFLVGKINNEICGLALLTKEQGRVLPFPIKSFHVGTTGEPFKDWVGIEHNQLLVDPKTRKTFIKKIVTTLAENFEWEEFNLEGVESTHMDDAVTVLDGTTVKEELCPIVNLDEIRKNKSTVLNSLSGSTRYQIKRSMKAIGNDFKVEWAENNKQAQSILEDLILLHQKRWEKNGKRGMFASESFTRFHKLLISRLINEKKVGLVRVSSQRMGIIGCLYFYIQDGAVLGYQSGFRSNKDFPLYDGNPKRVKPGFMVHFLCMEECFKRGMKEYNFGAGTDPYKLELATGFKKMYWISQRKSTRAVFRDFLLSTYFNLEKSQIKPLKKVTAMVRYLNS